jgi:hypothetical protein
LLQKGYSLFLIRWRIIVFVRSAPLTGGDKQLSSAAKQRHIHAAQSIQSNTRQSQESALRPFGRMLQP